MVSKKIFNINNIIAIKYEIDNDNKVLFKKLYELDKNGLKKAKKKWKPIFQFTKASIGGNKKHEIIKVAQENLFMLKRLNERGSVYSVDKWQKDYEISQYYKRNRCQYPSIDFYKTQRCNTFGNMFYGVNNNETKKTFSKTQYSKGAFNLKNNGNKKRKRFEDFTYKDLQMEIKKSSEKPTSEEKQFKKISEIKDPQEDQERKTNEENKEMEDNQEHQDNQEQEKENNELEKENNENNEEAEKEKINIIDKSKEIVEDKENKENKEKREENVENEQEQKEEDKIIQEKEKEKEKEEKEEKYELLKDLLVYRDDEMS